MAYTITYTQFAEEFCSWENILKTKDLFYLLEQSNWCGARWETETALTEPQCVTVQQKKKLNQKRTGINSPEKKQQRKQIPSSQILGYLQPKTRSKEKHCNYQKKKRTFYRHRWKRIWFSFIRPNKAERTGLTFVSISRMCSGREKKNKADIEVELIK